MPTLLLADDSITVQRVIALTFADEAIEVVSVSDGRQAMERMAAQRPDIVLAGTTLPHVSGYDLAKFMRSRPALEQVPVVLLTSAFESVDEAQLAASGARGFIEKPIEPRIVINRVKELLGLKSEAKPAATGRLVTSADAPAEKKLPVATPPRAVTSTRGTPSKWEQLRDQSGLGSNTRSVEDSSTRSDDYLDTLDDAFDTLDRQLSGRQPAAKPARNPAGPLGQSASPADPRSPGRRPTPEGTPGNPVFEVDDEWFGGAEGRAAAAEQRAGRSDIAEDLRDPELGPPAPAAPAHSIYEVDDEWFSEGDKVRAAKAVEQQQLAAEMGIHDVELPASEKPAFAPIDLDLGIELPPVKPPAPAPPAAPVAPSSAAPAVPAPAPPAPTAIAAPPAEPVSQVVAPAPAAPVGVPVQSVAQSSDMADDFAALLAYETGERQEHPVRIAPLPLGSSAQVAAAALTPEVLDQIAKRVADHLAANMPDMVRSIVLETSERLVREEIERIKNRKA